MPEAKEPGPARPRKSRPDSAEGQRPVQADRLLPARFVPGTSQGAHTAGASRDAPGARVRPTGWTLVNVAGTEEVLKAAGHPSDFENMGVYLAADLKVKEVAGRLVQGVTTGLTPMRYDRKTRTMVLYLHGMFRDFPQLRPTSESWVSLAPRQEDGIPFFVIQLNLSLRRSRSKRGQGDGGAPANKPTEP